MQLAADAYADHGAAFFFSITDVGVVELRT